MSQVKWQWPENLTDLDLFNLWLQEQGVSLREWQKMAAWFIVDQPEAAGKTFLIELLHRYESEGAELDERLEANRESVQKIADEIKAAQHKADYVCGECRCQPEKLCSLHAGIHGDLLQAIELLDKAQSGLGIPF